MGLPKPARYALSLVAFALSAALIQSHLGGQQQSGGGGASLPIAGAEGQILTVVTGKWQSAPLSGAGLGDFSGPASSTDGQLLVFNGTSGKAGKANTATGWLKVANGTPVAITPGTNVETFITTPTLPNLSVLLGTFNAGEFFGGPSTGSAATATKRKFAEADIPPTVTENELTAGTDLNGIYGSSYRLFLAADATIILPTAVSMKGKSAAFCVDSTSTGLLTVQGKNSENIDGQHTRILQANECKAIIVKGQGSGTLEWGRLDGTSVPMVAKFTRTTDYAMMSAANAEPVYFTAQTAGPASMWNSGTGQCKIVRPGFYEFQVSAFFTGVQAGDQLNIGASVNSGNSATVGSTFAGPAGAPFFLGTFPDTVMAVGDLVNPEVYDALGGSTVASATIPMQFVCREKDPW